MILFKIKYFLMNCYIELYNNNGSKYSIKSKIMICKYNKDEDNIKIDFQSKENFIKFEFDTLEEDIFINLKIDNTTINIEKRDNFRLNTLNEKYKRKLAYKIKWNLKTDKKIIIIKSLIINKEKYLNIYELLKQYAVEVVK
jgi:hypothetical protein